MQDQLTMLKKASACCVASCAEKLREPELARAVSRRPPWPGGEPHTLPAAESLSTLRPAGGGRAGRGSLWFKAYLLKACPMCTRDRSSAVGAFAANSLINFAASRMSDCICGWSRKSTLSALASNLFASALISSAVNETILL